MTKNQIINYLQEHKNEFSKKYQITKIALFGSYSRNENRVDSDVDITIETKLSDYFLLFDFKEELENQFHTKVDIVRLRDKMNMALRRRILKDGIYV
jgi:predicted nucleotidyltransferase